MSHFSEAVPVTSNRDAADQGARFAVLEIRTPETFQPKHGRHLPPLTGCWLTHERARELALALNADTLASNSNVWHLLAVCGRKNRYGVLRVLCDSREGFPDSPDGIPAPLLGLIECQTASKDTALAAADRENANILTATGNPTVWTVVIRSLADAVADPNRPQTSKGTPGKAGAPGIPREFHQDVPDWDQPEPWQTEGHLLQTGGAK